MVIMKNAKSKAIKKNARSTTAPQLVPPDAVWHILEWFNDKLHHGDIIVSTGKSTILITQARKTNTFEN